MVRYVPLQVLGERRSAPADFEKDSWRVGGANAINGL